METMREILEVPVLERHDVIVAGGGVAGCAATLAARRAGKSVLLLEKSLMLGGLATLGLINFFVPMCNGRGKQIVKGMAEEFLRLSVKYGYDSLPSEWKQGEPLTPTQARYVTRYSAPIFALALSELLEDSGVDMLLDTAAARPVTAEDHTVTGLMVENKGGRFFCPAGMVVDTTGDADLLYRAGMPTVLGQNYFTYIAHGFTKESMEKYAKSGNPDQAVTSFYGGHANLYGGNQLEGERLYTGVTAEDVTEYTLRNQRVLLNKLKKEDRNSREILMLPGMPQFRTTRHIDGDYTLTEEDTFRHFPDSIAAINDFDRRDYLYEVPLRCLTRKEYPNLITAGRSAAAKGYAWDVLRVIPPAIVTGQAAGLAAAKALEQHCAVAEVNIADLQQTLDSQNAPVHFDDALLPRESGGERAEVGHI